MKSTLQRISLFLFAGLICQVAGQNQLDEDIREVSNANNEFSTALYNTLRKNNPGNLLFSPFSLSSAMAMVKAGARGLTAQEIQKGMRFPTDDTRLFSGYRSLLSTLQSNENFTLETANRIYSQQGFPLSQEYVKTLKNYFNAEAEQLDFSKSVAAAQSINGWVEAITRNKIKNLVTPDSLDSLTRLVLVNAIYFKGLWAKKFDPEFTIKAPFYVSSTENVTVDMMKSESDYPYVDLTEDLDAKAVALPYKGDRLSLVVLLPNKLDGLAELERRLETRKMSDIVSKMRSRKVSLSMPRFKIETTIQLNDVLSNLGMKSMFQDSADFSGIPAAGSSEKLKISKAVQKAFLEVNEEGSEAAAATGFQLTLKSAFFGTLMKFGHPFMATIYDNVTDTVLFVNNVINPTVETSVVVASELTDTRSGLTHSDGQNIIDSSKNASISDRSASSILLCTVSLILISSFIAIRQTLMPFFLN